MSTLEAIETLVAQLTQELDQIQQTAQQGLEDTREKRLVSPDDEELTGSIPLSTK
ncbi:MAG: hypothetical protein ACFCU8_10990 [Thermosynechococcaceae cyanobacterium]